MNLKTTWNTLNHSDIWKRATKTGVQVFIPLFLAGLANVQQVFIHQGLSAGKSALFALVVSAGGTAVSAIWNYILQLSTPHITQP